MISGMAQPPFSPYSTTPPARTPRPSVSDVLRIQRPRPVHVARPLDDRPAVGEHRELVPVRRELQQKAIVTHLTHLPEMPRHLFKVQLRRRAMGHLHRVAAAQARRLRPLLAFQPLEAAPLTA